MRLTAALGWIVLLSELTGCMSTGQGSDSPSRPYGSPRPLPISDAAAPEADGAELASPAAQVYRLGPLDVIEVSVFGVPELTRTATVFDLKTIRTGQAPDPLLVAGDIVVVVQSAARTAWRDLRESIGVLGFFRPAIF